MTCWIFSSPASCAAPRESADIEVQPVTTSRATRSDRTDVVITLSEGRSRVERQGDASCRDRRVQAEHGGNLLPAVDPAQLDLPARHEAEEEDQRCVFARRRNSSWSRSITFVVRSVFHWVLGKRKNVRSSSPPSSSSSPRLGSAWPTCARRPCTRRGRHQHWSRRRDDRRRPFPRASDIEESGAGHGERDRPLRKFWALFQWVSLLIIGPITKTNRTRCPDITSRWSSHAEILLRAIRELEEFMIRSTRDVLPVRVEPARAVEPELVDAGWREPRIRSPLSMKTPRASGGSRRTRSSRGHRSHEGSTPYRRAGPGCTRASP